MIVPWFRRRALSAAVLIPASSVALYGFTLLFSSGIVGVTKKPNHIFAEPGCFCHGETPSPAVSAWIEGPETLGTGESALYRFRVARDSAVATGFNVAAWYGALGVVESTATQMMEPLPGEGLEVTHLMPRPAAGGDTVSWEFRYRAPFTAGLVDTIYAAGNSVDLSSDPSGDAWAFAPAFLVHVVSPAGVADPPVAAAFELRQNYPNPFNPVTQIPFRLAGAAEVRLAVFDITGREVALLVDRTLDAGEHVARFDAGDLSGGVYVYRILVRGGGRAAEERAGTRKMLVLK